MRADAFTGAFEEVDVAVERSAGEEDEGVFEPAYKLLLLVVAYGLCYLG